jgi:hypothetical protein
MGSERVRLADLLAAVSVATDLGNGQEPEKAIRACLVATALTRRMGTPEAASPTCATARSCATWGAPRPPMRRPGWPSASAWVRESDGLYQSFER